MEFYRPRALWGRLCRSRPLECRLCSLRARHRASRFHLLHCYQLVGEHAKTDAFKRERTGTLRLLNHIRRCERPLQLLGHTRPCDRRTSASLHRRGKITPRSLAHRPLRLSRTGVRRNAVSIICSQFVGDTRERVGFLKSKRGRCSPESNDQMSNIRSRGTGIVPNVNDIR